ncbi:hypothetical protein F0310_01020 [Borrelia sp. A-FGy1]|uniref:hypothetical protein n=1 Tax=Borrelia sp. A-FGy1 TaxID=2608247 RepID=UPI0015F65AE9|nr:hypothetical protein [Borrelia sp. A-FGy1]QMU99015.1 hypothetical protein F0310_01020 [Borrelia sp. A-FGy1]
MINNLKSQIQKLRLEKYKKLTELGKTLKNSNVIELKKLPSYASLKLIEKELTQLRTNLSKAEDNENKLKELYKNLKDCKFAQKNILKVYKNKLTKTIESLINHYPKNLQSILEYKLDFTKSMLEKHEDKTKETTNPNKNLNLLKKCIIHITLVIKEILNKINIGKVEKEFEKKILREHLSSENLEKLINKFIENKNLTKELIEEFRLINKAQTSLTTINDTIKETRNKSIKNKINNKNKIENKISIVEINKKNVLKKIAEEFIEMTKTEKGLSKTGAINSLLQQIENLNQQIIKLNEELVKTIKREEIYTIKEKMKQLIRNKESIENKLNKLNSKIEIIKNEIDELDNQ